MNEAQFFAPWRVVAEFADDSRLTFDGFTEEQARAAMEAAQNEHGDIAGWDHETDVKLHRRPVLQDAPPAAHGSCGGFLRL